MSVAFLSALEIRTKFLAGELTAVQIVESVLADIKQRDPALGAFLQTFDERALAQARLLDSARTRGEVESLKLAAIPVAIKDNLLYEGEICSGGSRILAEYKAAYTSTVVKKLIDQGAIVIGRVNMDEFAMGSSTETSNWQLTHNPWNVAKIPGGSSGGSAVAVAAGFVPLAFGSDTGGSIRQPASLCGVVGYKPSYGVVSRYGLMALSSSLDQVGPFARSVEDAALALSIIAGQDDHDSTSLTLPSNEPKPINQLRIGVPEEYFIAGIDPEVESAVREAIKVLGDLGATIVPIKLPLTQYSLPVYYIVQPAEASSNLARYDGIRYGTRAPGTLTDSYVTARGEGFGLEVKRRIMLGTFILSAGYYDAYYKKALAVRAAIKAEFARAFKDVDLIVSPTSPTTAWNIGAHAGDPLSMYLADIFTVPANIAGLPAISIPCGFSSEKLPIGLQLMGNYLDDASVLSAAAEYQTATNWLATRPVS